MRRAEADEVEHAGVGVAVPAPGVQAGLAAGAEIEEKDSIRIQAGSQKLSPIRLAEIEKASLRVRGMRPKNVRQTCTPEFPGDLGSDFVTRGRDAWSENRNHGSRVGPEPCRHGLNGFPGKAEERAPPAAVNGPDGTPAGIDDKEGKAVGRLDHKENAGRVRDPGISFGRLEGGRVRHADDIRMDLTKINRPEIPEFPVGVKIVLRPGRRAETMDEPWDAFKAGRGQDSFPVSRHSRFAFTLFYTTGRPARESGRNRLPAGAAGIIMGA